MMRSVADQDKRARTVSMEGGGRAKRGPRFGFFSLTTTRNKHLHSTPPLRIGKKKGANTVRSKKDAAAARNSAANAKKCLSEGESSARAHGRSHHALRPRYASPGFSLPLVEFLPFGVRSNKTGIWWLWQDRD